MQDTTVGFYILRNLVPAGIFLGSKYDENALLVDFDFVIPEYRDFEIGKYIYEEQKCYFINLGYTRLISYRYSNIHNAYLIKMGFKENVVNNRKVFVKEIAPIYRGNQEVGNQLSAFFIIKSMNYAPWENVISLQPYDKQQNVQILFPQT